MKITVATAILWLFLLPVAAEAATGNLSFDVETAVRSEFLDDSTDYVVTVPKTTAAPRDGYDELRVEPLRGNDPRGSFPVKVTFYRNGEVLKSINLAVRIDIYRRVLVTTSQIKRNQLITPTECEIARREVTRLRGEPVVSFDQLEEMCAARTLRRGQVLSTDMIKKIDLVERGDLVQIEFEHVNLKLTAVGECKQAGGRGDLIKVKNLSSKKIIIAEVQDEQTVTIVK